MSHQTTIPVEKIRADGGTQMRCGLTAETVTEYAALYREGKMLPPLVVFHDGTDYWLADGFHRLAALREVGKPQAICEVRAGSCSDAILYACGANSEHGLRRTNADKRRAVETVILGTAWESWNANDSAVARHCRVTHPFVANVRRELASCNGYKMPEEAPVERGGKRFNQKRGKRARADAELAAEDAPAPTVAEPIAAPVPPAPKPEPRPYLALLRTIERAASMDVLDAVHTRLEELAKDDEITDAEADLVVAAWEMRREALRPTAVATPPAAPEPKDTYYADRSARALATACKNFASSVAEHGEASGQASSAALAELDVAVAQLQRAVASEWPSLIEALS